MIPQAIHREGEANEGFELGERLLYLRTPYFSGKDVEQLQTALGALGFACGGVSGTFAPIPKAPAQVSVEHGPCARRHRWRENVCDAAPFAQCMARQASN